MKAPLFVSLSQQEMDEAGNVGKERHKQSTMRGHKNKAYSNDHLGIHIAGAQGESAFCKAIGIVWNKSVNTFKKPDALLDIQIRLARCRAEYPPKDFGRLIITDDDNPAHRYVLVVGNPPNFSIKGWILGSNAKQEKWKNTEVRLGFDQSSWFVPWQHLIHNLTPLKSTNMLSSYWENPGDETIRIALDYAKQRGTL